MAEFTNALTAAEIMDGSTGEVRINGKWQADVTDVTGTVRQERRTVNMSGRRRASYKGGQVSGEGTLRFQKVDDRWEKDFFQHTSLSLKEQRELKKQGLLKSRAFPLLIVVDDPEAYGASYLKLGGVIVWEMPVGYSLTELIERELPITWETEEPVDPKTPFGEFRDT